MNRRTFLTAIGTAIVATSAGCTDDKSEGDIMTEIDNANVLKPSGDGRGNGAKILRFVDDDAGTLVYVQLGAMGFKNGGMAALPLSETDLE